MAYASTLETALCTAASRAIREALSIEETIEDQQGRVYFYNGFIDLSNSKHYRWRLLAISNDYSWHLPLISQDIVRPG